MVMTILAIIGVIAIIEGAYKATSRPRLEFWTPEEFARREAAYWRRSAEEDGARGASEEQIARYIARAEKYERQLQALKS